LLTDDLRALIDGLERTASGARDAALLALGWAAAGSFALMASKASQDQAETIVVPCQYMPKACQALEAWATLAMA
jgi:hypothetical protein